MGFNPDSTGVYNGNYFGFEFSAEDSALSLLSVGYDATVSYRDGTSGGPVSIVEASTQVEIYDVHFPGVWQRGVFSVPCDLKIAQVNSEAREAAMRVIAHIESGGDETDEVVGGDIRFVNECSEWLNGVVYDSAVVELGAGRSVGLVGGDHSTPLGLIRALGERCSFGILHIDAHMDLRDGYEGFRYSHASIMRRALEESGVEGLTQVGVRDFSEAEMEFAQGDGRIVQFLDSALFEAQACGENWSSVCQRIVDTLPQNVYVSFDIDGLQAGFCPSTGTPVPGGISYNQAVYLLLVLHNSGRKVVGFDLCEVSPNPADQWDSIVGARVLYKLCNLLLASHK